MRNVSWACMAALVIGCGGESPAPPVRDPGGAAIAIQRVYAGRVADPDDDFVTIKGVAINENAVDLVLSLFDAHGTPTHDVVGIDAYFGEFAFGTPSAIALRGIVVAASAPVLDVDGEAGAACVARDDEVIDCVQWGAYDGEERGRSAPNAPPMAFGEQLRRVLDADDPDRYDAADDTDNSAYDFTLFDDSFASQP
jgi:hypothetical protein